MRVPASFDGSAVVFWVVALCAAGLMAWLEWKPEEAVAPPSAPAHEPVFVDLAPNPPPDSNVDGGEGTEW